MAAIPTLRKAGITELGKIVSAPSALFCELTVENALAAVAKALKGKKQRDRLYLIMIPS